jgi:hypothetical protein
MRTFYVLSCRDCEAESGISLPIPFASAEARGRWASEHKAGTGHDSWIVTDELDPGTT